MRMNSYDEKLLEALGPLRTFGFQTGQVLHPREGVTYLNTASDRVGITFFNQLGEHTFYAHLVRGGQVSQSVLDIVPLNSTHKVRLKPGTDFSLKDGPVIVANGVVTRVAEQG